MSKLKDAIRLQTAFGEYTAREVLGEGGAGRVYGGTDSSGAPVAIKVLTQASTDKRQRFKNEIAFLARNRHVNIVTVIDHGVADSERVTGPFYVMHRYRGSLRGLMHQKIPTGEVLGFFAQILDGVEAAHLLGATHRDIKPENVLFDEAGKALAIADFGVASFTESELFTAVETKDTQRLANFQYAAPEQRVPGKDVTASADVYALGLMLNEMYTGNVPYGSSFRLIGSVSKEHAYLDSVVEQMIKQNPDERARSISDVKRLIQRHAADAVSLQRLGKIDETVVKVGEIDEPLAHRPPVLTNADWNDGVLRLTLDRPVTREWVDALHNMGSFSSVMGVGPERFQFNGPTAMVAAPEHSAQNVVDHFKVWLPQATRVLKHRLETEAQELEARRKEELRRQRVAEETRLKVNRSLKI